MGEATGNQTASRFVVRFENLAGNYDAIGSAKLSISNESHWKSGAAKATAPSGSVVEARRAKC